MTDYTELVNDLRHADDLTADHKLLGVCARAAAAIEELQAQLPKRGEWEQVEVIGYDGNSMNDDAARCSVCGHVEQSVYWARTYYHYCPNCGAKMEVQE